MLTLFKVGTHPVENLNLAIERREMLLVNDILSTATFAPGTHLGSGSQLRAGGVMVPFYGETRDFSQEFAQLTFILCPL